ncbi:AI-2E family transporter [Rossellomorea vietnamensis]|uniref:AI-2E family transporter n=1 Tax=Rossellomorea vietnamensis TaxID=218284 RepID=A0A5D4NY66_9BACI|nr:AI-2E family transporter [Rossellomorea vietnamensis]TYS18721.1 AI-2E family transporter [Rossellomorea vietnamensis]
MPEGKWFRRGYAVALILLIIYLGTLVDFIFTPLTVLVTALFGPIVLGGIFYYLLRPLVNFLAKKMPRPAAILIIYVVVIGIFTGVIFYIGPILQRQINSLIENMPLLIENFRDALLNLQQNEWVSRFQNGERFSLEDITNRLTDYLNEAASTLGSNLMNIISTVTNIVVLVILIPFVLYYMLKDGSKLSGRILKLVPHKHEKEGKKVLSDMDEALSSYIQGQVIVSFCVGVLVYIGYLIIGLEYSLVIALLTMLTNVIPFVGPFISSVPAVIVGFLQDPIMALWVVIVILVVQQIEGNLISPQVMGRKLDIHPLTIILLLVAAGRFAGFLGLLLAVPTYAILKVIFTHVYRFIKLRTDL